MKNPYLNTSVSHATLNTTHLLQAFLPVLRDLVENNKEMLAYSLKPLEVLGKGRAHLENLEFLETSDYNGDSFEERASEFLNEDLFDALNYFAPDGFYFGSTEGDGSCYGFWETEPDYFSQCREWEDR